MKERRSPLQTASIEGEAYQAARRASLSILIPTCNFMPVELCRELSRQAEELMRTNAAFGCEIIVSDDALPKQQPSSPLQASPSTEKASGLEVLPLVRIVSQRTNLGRARNRNALIDAARGDYLLFIDADAQVVSDDFLKRYWDDRLLADAVCGRLTNPASAPEGHELRHRYELCAERSGRRTAAWRNRHPYAMLSTFSLMLSRRVVSKVRFDEGITHYGYEDVLLGKQLQAKGFSITHTDNPLLHTGINSSADFLRATAQAMQTLCDLGDQLRDFSALSRARIFIRRMHCATIFDWIFNRTEPALRRNLLSRRPSLRLFSLWKLGLYNHLSLERERHRVR